MACASSNTAPLPSGCLHTPEFWARAGVKADLVDLFLAVMRVEVPDPDHAVCHGCISSTRGLMNNPLTMNMADWPSSYLGCSVCHSMYTAQRPWSRLADLLRLTPGCSSGYCVAMFTLAKRMPRVMLSCGTEQGLRYAYGLSNTHTFDDGSGPCVQQLLQALSKNSEGEATSLVAAAYAHLSDVSEVLCLQVCFRRGWWGCIEELVRASKNGARTHAAELILGSVRKPEHTVAACAVAVRHFGTMLRLHNDEIVEIMVAAATARAREPSVVAQLDLFQVLAFTMAYDEASPVSRECRFVSVARYTGDIPEVRVDFTGTVGTVPVHSAQDLQALHAAVTPLPPPLTLFNVVDISALCTVEDRREADLEVCREMVRLVAREGRTVPLDGVLNRHTPADVAAILGTPDFVRMVGTCLSRSAWNAVKTAQLHRIVFCQDTELCDYFFRVAWLYGDDAALHALAQACVQAPSLDLEVDLFGTVMMHLANVGGQQWMRCFEAVVQGMTGGNTNDVTLRCMLLFFQRRLRLGALSNVVAAAVVAGVDTYLCISHDAMCTELHRWLLLPGNAHWRGAVHADANADCTRELLGCIARSSILERTVL